MSEIRRKLSEDDRLWIASAKMVIEQGVRPTVDAMTRALAIIDRLTAELETKMPADTRPCDV